MKQLGQDLPPDRMSGAERMAALGIPGRRPDRVPFDPRAGGFATVQAGMRVVDYYRDPVKSFEAQVATARRLGYDAGPGYGYAAFGAWEFGGDIRWPTRPVDQAPEVVHYPVQTADDVDRLQVPTPLMGAGAVPIMFAFSRLQHRNGFPVSVHLGGAFTRAASLVPPETLLRWMVREPDLVHRVLQVVTDFLLGLVRLWVEAFPGSPIVGSDDAPFESNHLISSQQFWEFSLPYFLELHERALKLGVTCFSTHLCGDHRRNLSGWAEIPYGRPGAPGSVSVGHQVDLQQVVDLFGSKTVVVGNVEPAAILTGTPEEVFELARQAIVVGKGSPLGYVLSPGCELPVDTPVENVAAMIAACRAYGQY